MRRFTRLLASRSALAVLAAALALPALAVAGAAAASTARPAVLFHMTITEKDRDGVAISPVTHASVWGVNGHEFSVVSGSAHVPPGTYIVADRLWRPADGSTQTLVAKKVHVTGPVNVLLDAQGAVAVTATTTAPGATQGPQVVELCLRNGTNIQSVSGYTVESPGTSYVKPLTASGLETVYQTYWLSGSAVYNLAGAFSGGIPASPVYHAVPASMAHVHVLLRTNENVTPLAIMDLSYNECGNMTQPVALPGDYTDFRTPGHWTTNLNFGALPSPVQKDLFTSANYLGGHSYTAQFGNAVYGPARTVPVIDGTHVTFGPAAMFADPVARTGFDCEGKAAVRLTRGATLIKASKLTFCGKVNVFDAHPGPAGFYNLTAAAVRANPSGSVPGTILSSSVTMAWHFRYAAVTGHPVNAQATPVTTTTFQPQGLDIANGEPAGATTTIRLTIARGGGEPVATPHYPLRPVHVLVSFNNGATWHPVAVTPHPGFWIVHVHNPASGYVSLRSVVSDTHGNSTTETIIRAYRV